MDSSSKYHKFIGKILLESPLFKLHKIVEEYPVEKVNPDWYSGRHRYDWAILDLGVIIEVHGQQHFTPIRWDGTETVEQSIGRFYSRCHIDWKKEDAAKEAGWAYVVVPFFRIDAGKVTPESLMVQIQEAVQKKAQQVHQKYGKLKPVKELDPQKQALLDRQRAYRRAEYKRRKELQQTWKNREKNKDND